MEWIRPTLLTALLAGLLATGCAAILGDDDDDEDVVYRDRIVQVRGTVDRVNTADCIIHLDRVDVERRNLDNEGALRDYGDEVEIHCDEDTVVSFEGRTYRPRDLERGDRVVVDVDDTGTRLIAREVEVTYDITRGSSSDRDDDYDRDRDRDDDDYDRDRDDDEDVAEVRGIVRWLDTDRRVLEIEDARWGWGSDRRDRDKDVVQLYFDADTIVEFEGRRYSPSNIERGDEVQVEVRNTGSRWIAEQILVVADVRDR